jgi:hypothetical protein
MPLDRSISPLIRTKTAAQWTGENPYLHRGDLGVETDTGKEKIGVGERWASTSYKLPVDDANVVKSVIAGITGAAQITNIVTLDQDDYDAIAVPDPNTLYVITPSP